METTRVGVVGLGTVGTGVVRLLTEHRERICRRAGHAVELARVVVADLSKPREVGFDSGMITDRLADLTADQEISVVCQLIGGLEPARSIMLQLLESGKDIVTANKALLAEHGPELFDRARELGRSIAFEASVGGGMPIINSIGQCLSANRIDSLQGILNGTSNFIVSQMEEQGWDFPAALAEAQARGYAEADPRMDIDGSDAAQKLAILSHLAFGARLHWTDIPCVGIDDLEVVDLEYAGQLGYRIKLLAIAQRSNAGLELHVSPTLVRSGQPLAEVRGSFNAVSVVGDAVGRVFLQGAGAGQMPTASAVVADLIDTAVGRTRITFQTLELWSHGEARVKIRDHAEGSAHYYLRFMVDDHPGVLAEISGVLGRHQVSIASLIQQPGECAHPSGQVPLVMMTHSATEGAAGSAMEEIEKLPSVRGPGVRMRVLS